jgi:copper resistance protein C
LKKIIVIIFSIFIMIPSIVSAHTALESSNPSEGQVVTEDLKEIILTYKTPIEELSTMKLFKDGNEVAISNFQIQEKQMIATFSEPLENGTYKVQWSIVGEDGHPITGEINFVVQKEQTEEIAPSPTEEDQGKTEDNTNTNSEDQNNEEQEKNDVISTETNEQSKEEAESSNMFIPILIGIVVILGIGLLLITRKKK